MRIVNLILTAVIVLPFTLLAGYYFSFILWKTLQDTSELTNWKFRLYFGGMVVIHVVSIALFLAAIYLVIYAGVWSG
jgi:hypothetical protein